MWFLNIFNAQHVRNGQVQTKWGPYALPNPQDADVIDKLLQATRDMIRKMPTV